MRALALVLMMATTASADGPKLSVTQISFSIERKRDGKKYPNDVKESYRLGRDGTLQYGAYFGNMPTDMNHNDSHTWKSGDAGKLVLAKTLAIAGDLTPLPDDRPAPNNGIGVYLVTITNARGDSTRYAHDPKSAAWQALHPVFQDLVTKFERATGRPKKPGDLPQRPR